MLKLEMHDTLMVLAVGVFADKKIHSSEIQVFMRSVSRVQLSKQGKSMLSEAKALSWFEMHKDEVRQMFAGPRSEFDAWFVPILKRVGKHADTDALLHLLNMIFLADHEMHNSEIALRALIKREWKLD